MHIFIHLHDILKTFLAQRDAQLGAIWASTSSLQGALMGSGRPMYLYLCLYLHISFCLYLYLSVYVYL